MRFTRGTFLNNIYSINEKYIVKKKYFSYFIDMCRLKHRFQYYISEQQNGMGFGVSAETLEEKLDTAKLEEKKS